MNLFKYIIILINIFICPAISQVSVVDKINPLLGTWEGTGGVIPSISHPFVMTQFCAMTRYPKVGNNCYMYNDTAYIVGFIATHQPAVWMGDYGNMSIMPGFGKINPKIEHRKM